MSAVDRQTKRELNRARRVKIVDTPAMPTEDALSALGAQGFSESSGRTGRRIRKTFFSDITGDGKSDF